MVWHFTGDYYATDRNEKFRARQRHRALESLMDMVACPEMIKQSRYSIRLMLKQIKGEIETGIPLKNLAELAEISQNTARTGLRSAWRIFAGLQSLYPIKPLARGLFAMLPWLPRQAAEIATLFYAPQLMRQADTLTNNIRFKHPVTGENETTTLEKLIDTAAIRASELCISLAPSAFDGAPIDLPHHGPSMDAGLSGVPTRQMHHYATTPFPKLP